MSEITLVRQAPGAMSEADADAARRFLFGFIDGLGERGRKRWRRFVGALFRLEPGEMVDIFTRRPRSGPFHRRHMLIESRVFDAQERFDDFEAFRYWLKVGAGFVTWAAGPKGGVVPIPKSISFDKAHEDEFREFHDNAIAFLRGPHAANYLWPHLRKLNMADDMMNTVLEGFDE